MVLYVVAAPIGKSRSFLTSSSSPLVGVVVCVRLLFATPIGSSIFQCCFVPFRDCDNRRIEDEEEGGFVKTMAIGSLVYYFLFPFFFGWKMRRRQSVRPFSYVHSSHAHNNKKRTSPGGIIGRDRLSPLQKNGINTDDLSDPTGTAF